MSVHSKAVFSSFTVIDEIPSGIVDGINTDFSIANIPFNNEIEMILNGLIQSEGVGKDYTLTGTTISFTKAPKINSILLVSYFK